MSAKPTFIIMIGPAGSGKGYIKQPLFDLLIKENIMKNEGVVECGIDDLVEADIEFQNKVTEYIKNNWTLDEIIFIENNTENIINNIISPASGNFDIVNKLNETATYLYDLYMKLREPHNKINDKTIINSLNELKNIRFETTGMSNFDWLYKEFLTDNIREKYNIVCVYPYVNDMTVLTQALTRFTIQAKKILDKKQTAPARLPKIQELFNNITKIQNNYVNYLNQCIENKNKIDYMIFYDNRQTTPKLVLNKICGSLSLDYKKSVSEFTDPSDNKNINIIKQNFIINKDKLGGKLSNHQYIKYKTKYLKYKKIEI